MYQLSWNCQIFFVHLYYIIYHITGNTMKRFRKVEPFNWSRIPSREGIFKVFFADAKSYSPLGRYITKDELCNSLEFYTKIKQLEQKKQFFKNMFLFTLAMIPFFFLFYNIFIGVF